MEDMIQQIIEADRNAQAVVNEAKKAKENAAEELTLKRRKMSQLAKERADGNIQKKAADLRAAAEVEWKNKEKSYAGVMTKLNADYEENHEQWVRQIVNRVLGK